MIVQVADIDKNSTFILIMFKNMFVIGFVPVMQTFSILF